MAKPARAITAHRTVAERKKIAELEASPRPYRCHYAGGVMHTGACKTIENAAEAAFSHVLRGHCSNAQVARPTGDDAFRMSWTSVGIHVWCPPDAYARPKVLQVPLSPFDKPATKKRGQLKRVK